MTKTKQLLIILISSLIITPAFATFYLGIQGGISSVDYPNHYAPGYIANSIDKTGLATRVYAGFDFFPCIGIETSVTYFKKPDFHGINNAGDSKTKNNLISLVAKGRLPLGLDWTLYGDLGFGYVTRSAVIVNGVSTLANQSIVRPVYGLGLSYKIWSRWLADLTWIQAPKRSKNNLPTSNFLGIGIRYQFSG